MSATHSEFLLELFAVEGFIVVVFNLHIAQVGDGLMVALCSQQDIMVHLRQIK